jgi:hypothetical protein
MPTDAEVVEIAASAAEDVILARLSRSDLEDMDVRVDFEDKQLEVDVYVEAPAADDAERVADDAALAARAAVDDLFDERS